MYIYNFYKSSASKYYKLHHNHGGQPLPCLYHDCFSSFKTWGSLRSHLSRNHSQESMERVQSAEILSFTCKCCGASTILTEREFFEHIGQHLKKNENCNFSTNIHGTFASHRSILLTHCKILKTF